MPKNTMTDLRNHLFETLEALKEAENPMDIQRAKAVVDVAQTIVNSAKVEVEFLAAIDSCETTEFFAQRRVDHEQSLPASPRIRQIAGGR